MANTTTIKNDPDVLWIQLSTAIREGRLDDAAEAQRKLAETGITVHLDGLSVTRRRDEQ